MARRFASEQIEVLHVVVRPHCIDVAGNEHNRYLSLIKYPPLSFLASMKDSSVFRSLESHAVGVHPIHSGELLSLSLTVVLSALSAGYR